MGPLQEDFEKRFAEDTDGPDVAQWQRDVRDLHRVMEVAQRAWLLLEQSNEPLVRIGVELATSRAGQKVLAWKDGWWQEEEKREYLKIYVKKKLKEVLGNIQPGAALEDDGDIKTIDPSVLAAAEQRAKDWEARFNACERNRAITEAQIAPLEEQLREFTLKAKEQDKALDKMRQELKSNAEEMKEHQTQISGLKEKNASTEKEYTQFKEASKEEVSKVKQKAEAQAVEFEKKLKALQESSAGSVAECKDLKQKLAESQKAISDMQKKLDAKSGASDHSEKYEKQIKQLEGKLGKADKEAAELRTDLEKLNGEMKQTVAELGTSRKTVIQLQDELQETQDALQKLKNAPPPPPTPSTPSKSTGVAKEALQAVEAQLREVEKALQVAEEQAKKSAEEAAAYKAELAQLKETVVVELETKVEVAETKVVEVETEVELVREKTRRLSVALEEAQAEIKVEYDHGFRDGKASVAERAPTPPPPPPPPQTIVETKIVRDTEREKELEEIIVQKDQEIEKLKSQLAKQRAENKALKEENASLEERNDKLVKMIQNMKKQIDHFKELAKQRGFADKLEEVLEESGLNEALKEFTIFDRLYQDAVRRQQKFQNMQKERFGIVAGKHEYQRRGSVRSNAGSGDPEKKPRRRPGTGGKYWLHNAEDGLEGTDGPHHGNEDLDYEGDDDDYDNDEDYDPGYCPRCGNNLVRRGGTLSNASTGLLLGANPSASPSAASVGFSTAAFGTTVDLRGLGAEASQSGRLGAEAGQSGRLTPGGSYLRIRGFEFGRDDVEASRKPASASPPLFVHGEAPRRVNSETHLRRAVTPTSWRNHTVPFTSAPSSSSARVSELGPGRRLNFDDQVIGHGSPEQRRRSVSSRSQSARERESSEELGEMGVFGRNGASPHRSPRLDGRSPALKLSPVYMESKRNPSPTSLEGLMKRSVDRITSASHVQVGVGAGPGRLRGSMLTNNPSWLTGVGRPNIPTFHSPRIMLHRVRQSLSLPSLHPNRQPHYAVPGT